MCAGSVCDTSSLRHGSAPPKYPRTPFTMTGCASWISDRLNRPGVYALISRLWKPGARSSMYCACAVWNESYAPLPR